MNRLHAKFQEDCYVSDLWNIVLEFQASYPIDPRLESVILETAEANFKEGIRLHNSVELDRAMIYYNHILKEVAVSSIHKDVQIYVDDINKPSAGKIYNDFQDAHYVSVHWNAA